MLTDNFSNVSDPETKETLKVKTQKNFTTKCVNHMLLFCEMSLRFDIQGHHTYISICRSSC